MGNKIARTTQVSASEYYLHDLPSSYNLVLMEVLGRGRFLKSILCKHDEGLVLVKVYFKRGDSLDLKEYERRLCEIREIFHRVQHPHIWPFQALNLEEVSSRISPGVAMETLMLQCWLETDKAAYLMRQHFFSNLHDRLSTRPFLSLIEKKWLAFQLVFAVKQSHENGVCHGDIKCENVLVTSWNWLYLADFASFKPTYIPHDDPSDFSFFFDTGGRRRCYLAPERFYEHGGEAQAVADAPLRPSMDIFSVGCVIAELFLEGQPLFELSQLLAYRRGQYDPSQCIEKIQDAGIQKMILHMIQLDPESRMSSEDYLRDYASVVFPVYFSPFLHGFFSCLIPLDSDARVLVTQSFFNEMHKQMMSGQSIKEILESSTDSKVMNDKSLEHMENGKNDMHSTGSFLRNRDGSDKSIIANQFQLVGDITSLIKEVEHRKPDFDIKSAMPHQQVKHYVHRASSDSTGCREKESPIWRKILKSDLDALMSVQNGPPDIYGVPFFPGVECQIGCEGMVLIASLLCSCLRSIKQPQVRRGAVLLLRSSSLYIDDEDRLQHVLPYVIAMLSDSAANVRSAALETLCDVLALVQDFPPSDAQIFPEYILPMLSTVPDDPEESVRICYASNIYKIALTAYRFLIQSQSITEAELLDKPNLPPKPQSAMAGSAQKKHGGSSDSQLSELRRSIAEVVQELVMGTKQTPNVRRALLQDIGHLCYFFGQRQCNDTLLPILPAFLNDRDEQLRAVFYGQITFVCYFVGQRSVEEYLFPYIEQALCDVMESVIVNALECLTMLCKSGFLRKTVLLGMIERAFPLLCYPIQWVRRSAVTFIAASSESLGVVDSYVYLSPVLRPFIHREPASLSSPASLLSCLKPPVSKMVFYQVLENTRSSDMLERQRKIWYNSSARPNQWETVEHTRRLPGDLNPMKSSGRESNAQGSKYLGFTSQKTSPSDTEHFVKLRAGNSFNASGSVDTRDCRPDKLQFSNFVSPQVGSGNSFIYEGQSEGIPFYSVCTDKQAMGAVPAGINYSMHWNSNRMSSSCMPLEDPVTKSFGLSNSVPPKLVSRSFLNTSNNSRQLPKSVHSSEGNENDMCVHATSEFQDVTVADNLRGSSSISADDALESDITGSPSFARASSVPDIGWKPRGVLIAHLQEHRSAVNDIAISNDNTFFVSVSDDSTVKIWDTRKLERDISFRSRLTYPLDGKRALCATMLRNTAQVVVGACDGTMHMFSVDYISRGLGSVVERYSGIADSKTKEVGEGAILSLLNCSTDSCISQAVLYSTQSCGIHLWDTRMESETWNFKAEPEEGYISSLVMGQCGNWFVSGSSRGALTLWDLRFLLPVYSWKYSTLCPVEKMSLYIPPANSMSTTGRPLVYVAAGCNEVSLWNAENGSCHQVFRVDNGESDAEMSNVPRALARPSNKSISKQDIKRNPTSKYRSDELSEPPPRLQGMRALLPLPGGDLLTGGTDLKIRYWDHSSPDRSYCVCGPTTKGIGNDEYYDIRSSYGVQVVQETNRRPAVPKLTQKALLAVAATDSAGCHRDSVRALASVKLNQRLLVSGSRDGVIKVWK